MNEHGHPSSITGMESNNDSNPQCSMEWPSDWYVEQPRAIHQDWPMNSQFDLNLDCPKNNQFNMEGIFTEDLVYESHSSEQSGSGDDDVPQDHQEGDTDVEELFPVLDEEELVEDPAVEKAAILREARSKDAKAKAVRIRQVKERVAAGTIEDSFVLSDSCSDDNKDILCLSDDDGAVQESEIAVRTRKSRAKPTKKRTYYDESKSSANVQFALDLCFHDVTQLRKAIENYHIAEIRNFIYLKNNQERVIACCSSGGTCPFMINSSEIKGEKTHCIRQIIVPHTGGAATDTSRISSTWVAKKYEDLIKSDPAINITALIDAVNKDHGIEISKHMAYRAKNKALEAIEGDEDSQYLRIRDYLHTVMEKNPGSRCHVWTIRPINKPEKNPRFHGLFFGLHAQIEGFKNGCRPFIGIDGCFLKLGNGAQVLAATYAEILEWEKRNARWCTAACANKGLWQVTNAPRTYEVNLIERKCGCFKWDLTGIPCKHAISAINKAKEFPEDYVSAFFKKPMYKEAYKHLIYPVPGPHGWTRTETPDIDPPEYKTKRGRKQKKRRKGKHESSKSSVQARMTTIRCSNCKLQGHRYTNCTQPLKPHLAIRKSQHKTVRRLPDEAPAHARAAAPPQAPPQAAAPRPARASTSAPRPAHAHGAAPPPAPPRAATQSSQESSVTGISSSASGSGLGMRGYEDTRLYSYFTAGQGYQAPQE